MLDHPHLVRLARNFSDFLFGLFACFSWNPHALAMFTEGLDRDALKWVREVSELAAPPNPPAADLSCCGPWVFGL